MTCKGVTKNGTIHCVHALKIDFCHCRSKDNACRSGSQNQELGKFEK